MVEKLVGKAIALGVIKEEDAEVYAYSYNTLFVKVLMWAGIILLGAVCNRFVGSLLFMAFFIPLRQYAGGFHLRTAKICFVSTMAVFALIIAVSWLPLANLSSITFAVAAVICLIGIFMFAPQDDENKPCTENELRHYKKMARVVALIEAVAIILCTVANIPGEYLYFMTAGLLLSTVLVAVRAINRMIHRTN